LVADRRKDEDRMSRSIHGAGPIPAIETDRLILRAHRPDDFSACAAMWADPVVTRYITGKPSTQQQTWSRMLQYAGLWSLLGFGYWAIEERAGGAFVGELGFADFKRVIEPPLDGTPELGWALVTAAHGKGYASEATRAAVAWGDANLSASRTVCLISPENLASMRVAEKCGYREFARTAYGANPVILLARQAAGR
jgi:RimJ/RimL family protein N-acetyltransferase